MDSSDLFSGAASSPKKTVVSGKYDKKLIKEEVIDEKEVDESEDDEDDDEGTYFIDQLGRYYYQATKDSEPVLTDPPDGEYVPEDDQGVTGEEAAVSLVLLIEDPAPKQPQQEVQVADDGLKDIIEDTNAAPDDDNVYEFDDGDKDVMEPPHNISITDSELGEDDHLIADERANIYENDLEHTMDEERKEVKLEFAHLNEDDVKSGSNDGPTRAQISVHLIKKMVSATSSTGDLLCSHCPYTTPKKTLLMRHMKSHSEDRPHKCVVCERGFKTYASLNNHTNTHTGTKPHHCRFCATAFTTSGELVRHVRYKHTHEKPHKCTECDYASVELSKLKRHIRCHTGERPYQCPHCTYASPDTFKLKRHLRIHTGEKPYQCTVCQAKFTQSNSLKAHKLIHNVGDKPVFQCQFCPTTCGRKTDLRIHIQKLHTSDRPLQCKRCDQSFPDRYSYKLHAKTHDGEKCYKCDLCPYASTSARHLETHMLVHTDQKPYVCPHCGQTFRQKQLLRRHENLYHDPLYVAPQPHEKTHHCPDCNKPFRHKGNLLRHMTLHDPDAMDEFEALKDGRRKRMIAQGGVEYVAFGGRDMERDLSGLIDEDAMDCEEDDEEEEEEDEDGENEDRDQYVVLEVIQMGEEDTNPKHNEVIVETEEGEEGYFSLNRTAGKHRLDLKKEKETNFGFNEDVDDLSLK